MTVGGQTEARAQLSSTIFDYHEPFDQDFKLMAGAYKLNVTLTTRRTGR